MIAEKEKIKAQNEIDAYFKQKKQSGILKLIINAFLMIGGLGIMLSASLAGEYLNSESIEYVMQGVGLLSNIVGLLAMKHWILEDREYVFPRK